jgi:hypothetical protein
MLKCEICNREFKTKQALNSHIGWHNTPNRKSNLIEYNSKVKNKEIEKVNTNQYTKAKNEGRKIIISEETRKKLSIASKKQVWDEKRREKQRIAMQEAVRKHPASYSANNVSGRTKTIEYKGFNLKGSWELEVAKWLDKHGIKWTNEVKGFEYFWEGKIHLYFPDFYLTELDKYIEVKGYERERDRKKWEVIENLIVFKKKEIELIRENVFSLN